MSRTSSSLVSKSARFAELQIGFDFESFSLASDNKAASASLIAQLKVEHSLAAQFTNAFIRMQADKHGIYKHHFLCACGEHFSVQTDDVGTDLCPSCHAELDPYVTTTSDFKLTERQLENRLITERFRVAFNGTDIGQRVFSDILNKLPKVSYSQKDVGEICYS